jgi:predicted porin
MEMTMIGGLMKRGGIIAVAAAASIYSTSAMAADLGGDCCADLEERVAELEATTARKGNRKVSLTISGQVNELVYWWDNGEESNVYQGTSGFSSSRFRMKGSANISEEWSAGYYIEIETVAGQVNTNTAEDDDGRGPTLGLRHSMWYLKSKRLGQMSVGYYSFADDDILSSMAVGGTATAAQGNYDAAPGMGLNFGGTNLAVRDVFDVRDIDRGNIIRYDSPSIAGFTLSAAWGEDDRWDVALRYAGEFNGIKIAAGIGYHEDHDNGPDNGPSQRTPVDYRDFRMSGGVLHVPTGLFVDAAYVNVDFDPTPSQAALNPDFHTDNFQFWYIRPGIYRKWHALGKTSIFGEYGEAQGSGRCSDGTNTANIFQRCDGTFYGVGVQQYVDAAAMEIYLGWRHFEADLIDFDYNPVSSDDVETVYTGARIKF